MADREDNVYKAKLAEQAERYDGMLCIVFATSINVNIVKPSILVCGAIKID